MTISKPYQARVQDGILGINLQATEDESDQQANLGASRYFQLPQRVQRQQDDGYVRNQVWNAEVGIRFIRVDAMASWDCFVPVECKRLAGKAPGKEPGEESGYDKGPGEVRETANWIHE